MADFNIYPALDVQQANPLSSYLTGLQGAQDITLAPSKLQAAQNTYTQENTAFGNSMLSQVADEALAAPPDQQSSVWDAGMSKLGDRGKQYVGRFDPNTAKNVQSVFSGKGQYQPPPPSPQLMTQIYQMQPQARSQALAQQNEIINGFRNINNADDFVAEVQKAEQLGVPLDKIFPGVNLMDTSEKAWRNNYQLVNQRIQQHAIPFRDALQEAVANDALGVPAPQNLKEIQPGVSVMDLNTQRIIATAPDKSKWAIGKPTETGMAPFLFNEANGARIPLTPENAAAVGVEYPGGGGAGGGVPGAAQAQFAQQLNQSESSGDPNAQATTSSAGGLNGMTDSTYVANVKKLVPALANASPAQILAMKKSGALAPFNTSLTIQQNTDDAAALTKAGFTPTNATVGIMYKLGAADGMKLLQTKDPNTPMSQIVSKAAMAANPQFANMTAGQYTAGIYKQFGNAAYGQEQQGPETQKYGNFENPQLLEYTDKDGFTQHVLAEHDKIGGKWVTADGNRTVLNFPNGDQKIIPASMGGGRNAQMVTRQLTAAEDFATAAQNLAKLKVSASMGPFGMRGATGDGSLVGSAINTLVAGKMTTTEQKFLQNTMVGTGRALAELETGGAASAGGVALLKQFDQLAMQVTDNPLQALSKLGEMRQLALNAINSNMASPYTGAEQRKEFQKAYDRISTSIPWTQGDVIDYYNAGMNNKQLTFAQYAKQKGIGGVGAGAQAYPTPPTAAITRLKANPKEQGQFDQIFGPGAAKRALGGG